MGDKSAMKKKDYLEELDRLTVELVKLQEWVKARKLKVVVLFEGRDAAGKGGVIKAITGGLNPRYARIAALAAPTERERNQWYFQRYAAQLPTGGEMVFFDRSWYNRAGVERVMGFCTEEEYREFARSVPEFERMLQRAGIILIKYWFSVSDEVQEARFRDRLEDPAKRWKLSPMDMDARSKWIEYSKAKDDMFEFSDLPDSPWYVVDADDKYCARLNTIVHFLGKIPFGDLTPEPIELPPRQEGGDYRRPPIEGLKWIPRVYPEPKGKGGKAAKGGKPPKPGKAEKADKKVKGGKKDKPGKAAKGAAKEDPVKSAKPDKVGGTTGKKGEKADRED